VQIEPDVSVVVPVWGAYAGPLLDEALASLQTQDLPARIIVVDNASEPPLPGRDGVDVVRAPARLTVGAARNLGLEAVTTPYVLFWDADDLMLPGTLRFLRDRIAAEPDVVLVAAAILEGEPAQPHRWPRHWTFPLARRRSLFALGDCVWSLFPTTGSALIRTGPVRESRFADANSGEDWVLGVSLAFRGRVLLEARPGRIYRQHPQSLWATQRSTRQLVRNAAAVRERIRADAGIPRWAGLLLPAIAALQLLAAGVIRPVAELARRFPPAKRSVN
jgi:hypothetical protein